MTTRLTLVGKPGCHLCDVARDAVTGVIAGRQDVILEERSLLDDPELQSRYAEKIPVLLVDDTLHSYWRVDPDKLRSVLGSSV